MMNRALPCSVRTKMGVPDQTAGMGHGRGTGPGTEDLPRASVTCVSGARSVQEAVSDEGRCRFRRVRGHHIEGGQSRAFRVLGSRVHVVAEQSVFHHATHRVGSQSAVHKYAVRASGPLREPTPSIHVSVKLGLSGSNCITSFRDTVPSDQVTSSTDWHVTSL